MCNYDITIHVPFFSNPYMGSETEKNLWSAFIGESMARNRYTYYASVAKKAGYEELAGQLLVLADIEKEHAKIWLKKLNQIGDVDQNLAFMNSIENHEWGTIYPQMARVANEEGYPALAELFRSIAKVEGEHEAILWDFQRAIRSNTVFSQAEPVVWECRNCGHTIISDTAPEKCPVCSHPQGYFQISATIP